MRLRVQTGFTLVEILVSFAILAVLLVIMASMTDQVQRICRLTQGKAEQFREARVAFEAITRRLAQATLNTYWDYDSATSPTRYLRQSELRFRCGRASVLLPPGINSTTHAVFFQAPFGFTASTASYGGMETMLNTWGYFIEFGDDLALRPQPVIDAGVPKRYRFRLYEMMESSESLSVYAYTSGTDSGGNPKNFSYNGLTWFQDPLNRNNRSSRVLAENVIALIFLSTDASNAALTSDYQYDSSPDASTATQTASENQLPPNIQVTMVAIDEASARRLDAGATAPDFGLSTLFQTVGDVTNASNPGYAQDLKKLGDKLTSLRINYRIFTTNVSIRGAKWSRN